MSDVTIGNVAYRSGDLAVTVDGLEIAAGGRLAVFGPNGAGKTTLLRLVAGTLGGDPRVEAAYLPQRPFLFRGTAHHNLVLGLPPERVEIAERHAEVLGVGSLLHQSARTLSGGERQRVALARTLASARPVVLLDEPLAAVDAKDRPAVAAHVVRSLGERTAMVVTHDRDEAVTLGTELAVMIAGRIRQRGPVREVMSLPADEEVAAVLGVSNALPGSVVDRSGPLAAVDVGGAIVWGVGEGDTGSEARVLFGAETVIVYAGSEADAGSARNRWSGRVADLRPIGQLVEVLVDVGPVVAAVLTPGSVESLELAVDHPVTIAVKATAVRVVPS